MLIEFTKTNSIIHFIVGMVMSLVFRRYIYGSLIILFSILVAFQHVMIHSELELLSFCKQLYSNTCIRNVTYNYRDKFIYITNICCY